MGGFSLNNLMGGYMRPTYTQDTGSKIQGDPKSSFVQNTVQGIRSGQGVLPSLLGAYQSHRQNQQSQQQVNEMGHQGAMNAIGQSSAPMPPPPPVGPNPSAQSEPSDDMLGSGAQIVDKPTRVILGDDGPEAVVPLNSNPGNKVSTNILFGPMRSRYRG
jgi:hypothetical protein